MPRAPAAQQRRSQITLPRRGQNYLLKSLISLQPWYAGPHAPQITAAIGRAEAAMQRAAQDDHSHTRPAARPVPYGEEIPS